MERLASDNLVNFKRVESVQPVVDYLLKAINTRLAAGQKVLWLVAGGSSIDIALKVAKKLSESGGLPGLLVTLTDERYGDPGHKDSNWQQLLDKGFSLPGARLYPVLSSKSLEKTTKDYSRFLADSLNSSDYSIALAGMGADGHIFGIKPLSPAVDSPNEVVGYKWDDFVRITPTITLLRKINEIIIYATGKEKHQQFDKLDQEITPEQQPAQLLKSLPKVTIFNDYRGEVA